MMQRDAQLDLFKRKSILYLFGVNVEYIPGQCCKLTQHKIDSLLIRYAVFYKEFLSVYISWMIQQYTVGSVAITTCTSRLLEVAFKISRHLVVNDVANIRLVYSHSKCLGTYHNIDVIIHEEF